MMKRLIILLAFIAFLAGYPLVNEDTGNACSALEKRWYTLTSTTEDKSLVGSVVIRSLIEAGEGVFASEYVRKQLPNIPPAATCYYYYWRSFLDENWLRGKRPPIASALPVTGGQHVLFVSENE
jgi:hypothetical protein